MSGGRGLLTVLTAIFVSLCTVVGEALMPSNWPPQNWFASIVAVLLIAITFVVGVIAPGFLDAIPDDVRWRSQIARIRAAWRERTLRAATLTVSLAVLALGMWLTTPVTALEQVLKDDRVGGLDLSQYCKPHGYTESSAGLCSWTIPLDKACDWQYEKADLHFTFVSSDPNSGECHTRRGKTMGGISDMQGFCRDHFGKNIDVDAAVADEKTWQCQTPVDKNLACSWLYLKRGLVARKDGSLWSCYE